MDAYLTDIRAVTQMEMDLKIFRMNRLGLPQERIAKRVGQTRDVIRDHLGKMPICPRDSPRHRWLKSTAGQNPWSGPWPLMVRMIFKDFRNFAGVFELGINGSSMIVTKDLEMNGPDAFRPR